MRRKGFWLPQGTDPRLVPMSVVARVGSVWRLGARHGLSSARHPKGLRQRESPGIPSRGRRHRLGLILLARVIRRPAPAAPSPRRAPCPGLPDDGYPLDSVEQDQLDAIEDALRADADPIRLGADYWTKGWKP